MKFLNGSLNRNAPPGRDLWKMAQLYPKFNYILKLITKGSKSYHQEMAHSIHKMTQNV